MRKNIFHIVCIGIDHPESEPLVTQFSHLHFPITQKEVEEEAQRIGWRILSQNTSENGFRGLCPVCAVNAALEESLSRRLVVHSYRNGV